MKLKPLTRAGRRRADIDAVLAAYSDWKRECAAVRDAYGRWGRLAKRDARYGFAAYRAALDREERAADSYARLLRGIRPWPELDVARQLTGPRASSERCSAMRKLDWTG